MVADFNMKADLKKVSQTIKDLVSQAAKLDGSKKKIDSEREFNELSNLLAGNAFSMNKDEMMYVQGFMLEYQNKKFENSVTENTKKEVSKIAKRMGDKKKIDTDEEAQALSIMLRNSHNDLNAADLAYVKNLLITSGYGHYLSEQRPHVNVVNVIISEQNTDKKNENEKNIGEETAEDVPVKNEETPEKKDIPPIKKLKPRPRPKIEEKSPSVPPQKSKPEVAEEDRTEGFGLADRIVHELNSHIADNDVVRRALSKVNSKNAYSFVGKFIGAANKGINDGVFGLNDMFNKLTYRDTVHVMSMLLKQAADLQLNNTPEYKELEFCIKSAERKIDSDFNADPEDFEIKADDKAIKALYMKMSKKFE